MGQAYSNPKRASMPHALPDIEVFRASYYSCADCSAISFEPETQCHECGERYKRTLPDGEGYFWWSCFPGCMPDSDPFGPFATEQEALEDAQSNAGWDEDEQG